MLEQNESYHNSSNNNILIFKDILDGYSGNSCNLMVKDTNTEEIEISCEMSYSFKKENGKYQLELDSNNSPYPMI